ncbi:MAG: pilus assembly protein TadG-related protein [Gaiellaceae bacterium]
MSALLTRMRSDSGQAMLFVIFAIVGLVAIVSLVVDGGSWFRTQRQVQTAADAAALAGAQDIPNQAAAGNTAVSYAQQNFSGIAAPTVTFPSAGEIDVVAAKPVSGIILPALNATARAHARAKVSVPGALNNVAPIAVKSTVACAVTNPGCYGQTVTVSFDESQVTTSSIGLINVKCNSVSATGCDGGQTGGNELKDEIECTPCWSSPLPANRWYGVKTGETVGPVRQGLQDAADRGQILFFPVFDQVGNGGRAFHIIGWAAFVIHPTGVIWGSQTRQLTGHFVTFIATDLAAGDPIEGGSDFGVHVITLIQ